MYTLHFGGAAQNNVTHLSLVYCQGNVLGGFRQNKLWPDALPDAIWHI